MRTIPEKSFFYRRLRERREERSSRNMKRSGSRSSKPSEREDSNVAVGTARFTFKNGDIYEGKYRRSGDYQYFLSGAVSDASILRFLDRGVYITDNFDVYDGKWRDDQFGDGEFYIRYNDNAQYKGNVDADGTMNGTGTYLFPEKFSLTAVWSRNKPVSDIVFREPHEYEWITTSISDSHVTFTTANQFWNELHGKSSKENCSPFVPR